MYAELREMEAAAEAKELDCVQGANNNATKTECTVEFIDVAESIDDVKLAARASGVGQANDAAVARAAVHRAKLARQDEIKQAEADEIACVEAGGEASAPRSSTIHTTKPLNRLCRKLSGTDRC